MSILLSDKALNRTLSRLDRLTAPHGSPPVPYYRRRRVRTTAMVLYGGAVVLLLISMAIMPFLAEHSSVPTPL